MRYFLYKNNDLVGEAIVMSENNVVYHLYKNIRLTHKTNLTKLKRKFKIKIDK